jgi:hypothetical protein
MEVASVQATPISPITIRPSTPARCSSAFRARPTVAAIAA